MKNETLPPYYYGKDGCFRLFESFGFISFINSGFMSKSGVTEDVVDEDYPYYTMVYVLRGRGTYIDHGAGKKYPVEAGSVFQRIPGRRHSLLIDPESNWSEVCVAVGTAQIRSAKAKEEIFHSDSWPWRNPDMTRGEMIVPVIQFLGLYNPGRPVFTVGVRLDIASQFKDMIQAIKAASGPETPGLMLRAINLIQRINAAAESQERTSGAETAARISAAIAADPACRKPVRELLRKIPLSYSRLRAIFRAETGMSVEACRIQRRVEEACRLLSQGESPGNAAAALGYNDYFAFSRQFKQITGMPPRSFSRAMSGKGGRFSP
jgi:AraC-like DNA-binding protein